MSKLELLRWSRVAMLFVVAMCGIWVVAHRHEVAWPVTALVVIASLPEVIYSARGL